MTFIFDLTNVFNDKFMCNKFSHQGRCRKLPKQNEAAEGQLHGVLQERCVAGEGVPGPADDRQLLPGRLHIQERSGPLQLRSRLRLPARGRQVEAGERAG